MESNIVEKAYREAVEGIKEEWLDSLNPRWYEYIMGLPIKSKVTYMVVVLHDQVINGGFHQYFCNAGYGQFALKTISCLEEINALNKAKLLRQAYDTVNSSKISDELFIADLINQRINNLFDGDDLYEPLGVLDEKFYDSSEEIEPLLIDFLKK
ncbi:DMP19 family protein [Maribacter sp. 2-571]|uniref:DMP19 family protein n=1 Tax=Maribacter sp. 2-571 TaxID=3417569 RepID=UPI003D354E45